MWSALDSHIGIIVACLPSLRPYFGNKDQGYGAKSNSDVKSMPSHAGVKMDPYSRKNMRSESLTLNEIDCGPSEEGTGSLRNGSQLELVQTKVRVEEIER